MTSKTYRIACIPGDGIGKEVIPAGQEVLQALAALTKVEGEDYPGFIRRAAQNPLARRVKRADLAENSDLSRIPEPSEDDRRRLEKYRQAIQYLDSLDRP